jgi:hypothetical protein
MYKNATECNETIGKWCKNKHGASKIIDTFETYQHASSILMPPGDPAAPFRSPYLPHALAHFPNMIL